MLVYLALVVVAAHRSFRTRPWLGLPPYLLALAGALLYFLREQDAFQAVILAVGAIAITWGLIFATRKQIP